MRRQVVEASEVVINGQPPVKASAEALGGFGGVLGDVAGHLLSRQLPRLVLPSGDVADVELLTPPGITGRPTIDGRAGHPDGRDRLLEGVVEEGGGERLRWWGQAARTAALGGSVQADDGMEVDRAPLLELGHLGVADSDHLPEPGLVQADLAGQGTLDGDGGSPPELRGERVPQD